MKTKLFPLWVIIDVLVCLSAAALWIAAPEYKTLNLSVTGFGVCLGMLLVILRLPELKIFVASSYFRKAAVHLINVALVAGILGLANYLGNKNYREFDITQQKRNSLTEQTKKILEQVKGPLTLSVYSKREEWGAILAMLKLYESQNRHIKLNAVDTDLRPDLVKLKNIDANGTVVIDYLGKETKFVISDELSVTNALLKALNARETVIYLTSGHNELACENKAEEGVSALCDLMKSQNYQVKSIDLSQTKDVPKDASAVLVFGPHAQFFPSELEQLERYLKRGGNMFVSLSPQFVPKLYDGLLKLAAPYGMKLGEDIVVDRLSTVQGAEATIPIVSQYNQHHAITAGFEQRTVFPLSASVRKIPGNDSVELLASTSSFPGSWAESDLKAVAAGKADFKEGVDVKGPVGLIGVGETVDSTNPSRFVLLGSTSFLLNGYQAQSGNATLFLNTVSWLVNDEGIISFNRPGLEENPVILSAQHLHMIFVISILLVPIVFFGTGIFVYRRRRVL
jgi:ABC-type uncharacterized transport system involved in gliding motility auxiliary subunit